MSQGNLAATQGKVLEHLVETTFQQHHFSTIYYSHFREAEYQGEDVLLKNVPFTNIYGTISRTEFVARSQRYNMCVRIECKWQQSCGSVDEKFPYMYLNCIEAMPENDIIILIDGNGYRPAALTWLQNAVNTQRYVSQQPKNIQVMNMSQFIIWANTTLR